MAEEIVLKLEVDNSGAGRSLSGLRQEFKALQKELDNTQVGSEKYIQTLQKLGKVKDEIGDLNQTINAFHPEGKIQAIQNVVGGLASGFQAATAATALFGDENEDLTKTLVKVQSAMAFADGIKGVMALKDSFAVLNAVIAANPITAVIVGITALTAAVYGLVEADEDLVEQEKELYELQKKRNAERDKEIALDTFKRKLKTDELEQDLKVAKARGDSEQQLYELERKLLLQRAADLQYIKAARGQLTKDEALELRAHYNDIEILDATHQKTLIDNNKKSLEDKKKDLEKYTEAIRKNKEEAARLLQEDDEKEKEVDRVALEKRLEATQQFIQKSTDGLKRSLDEERDYKLLKLKEDYQNTTGSEDAKEAYKKAKADIISEYEQKKRDEKKAADDKLEELEQKRLQERMMATTQSIQAISSLSNFYFQDRLNNVRKGSAEEQKILKRQFEVNKKFSTAKAILDGANSILAITSTAVDPTGITTGIRVAAQVALTAAQIATIQSANFNGGGSTASGASVSAPTSGVQNIPNSGRESNTQPQVQTQSQTIPVRAYVVEQDVTTIQNMARVTRSRAEFS